MHPRVILSTSNFFFAFASALTGYIVLPFLSLFMPESFAGLVIACGGAISIVSFFVLPRIISRYGAQEVALTCAIGEMIVLFALAAAPGAIAAIVLVIVMLALQPVIAYGFDLLLEATVTERKTVAEVRSLFLTAWNIGVCAAPLVLGALLDDSNAYVRVYIAAATIFVPLIVLLVTRSLPKGIPPKLSHFTDTLKHVLRNRDLSAITFAHFLLYLFFSWAPLYIPIYLHTVVGISWATLGWIFAVMLVPYVLVEYPAGWIADRYIGDKELLLSGFLLAGGSLIALGTLPVTSSLSLILIILIVSRVGAALIESMTEGHFFRRVEADDIGSVSFFRGVWPLATVVGPIVGSIILFFFSFQILFIATGCFLILAGAITAGLIEDFK
ncbi:MAG: hypothetical protein JWN18_533 [Parcubacteria group bacterium]|nr:hypothetical protein [Parcubacteria group bacterium]